MSHPGAVPGGPPAAPTRLLFVCTANQCRSPLAEVIARARFAERGLTTAISSAGLLPGGVPAARGSVKAAAALGLDLSSHVSRHVDEVGLAGVDLVLTMEAAHVVELCTEHGANLGVTFTLGEAARAARERPGPDDDWLAGLRATRTPTTVLGLGRTTDVADPMGMSARRFRQCAATLSDLIGDVLGGLDAPHR